ncbi:MAG TPA: hypothetical protein VIJ14_04710, partial [Rhabdochlamydiaceae bacterium]
MSDSRFLHSPSIENREQNGVQEGGLAAEAQSAVDVPATRGLHRSVATILAPIPRKGTVSQEILARFSVQLLSP